MRIEQVFIGNILKCTKYEEHTTISSDMCIGNQCIEEESFGYIEEESEVYKEDAVLIKFRNGGYVDLENIHSIIDYIRICKDISKNGYREGLMMSTSASCCGSLFVDYSSLKTYYSDSNQKVESIRVLKKRLTR